MPACYRNHKRQIFDCKIDALHLNKVLQYSSKILLLKQFVACQLNQARIVIMQYAYRCHRNQCTDFKSLAKAIYFASVQIIINQQPYNRILTNIFSYYRFRVLRARNFCLGVHRPPWPPLVAALWRHHHLRRAMRRAKLPTSCARAHSFKRLRTYCT